MATDDEELAHILGLIRDTGQYPVTMTETEHAELGREAIDEKFAVACLEQVGDWMERAAERLEPNGVPIYVTGGNDDYFSIEKVLDDAPYIQNAEGQVLELSPGLTHDLERLRQPDAVAVPPGHHRGGARGEDRSDGRAVE